MKEYKTRLVGNWAYDSSLQSSYRRVFHMTMSCTSTPNRCTIPSYALIRLERSMGVALVSGERILFGTRYLSLMPRKSTNFFFFLRDGPSCCRDACRRLFSFSSAALVLRFCYEINKKSVRMRILWTECVFLLDRRCIVITTPTSIKTWTTLWLAYLAFSSHDYRITIFCQLFLYR